MKGSFLASRPGSLMCPLCEVGQLHTVGHHTVRCESCNSYLNGGMLEALRQITALPDVLGRHACEECGHPEMRHLPDGTLHCPACGSEVLPIDAASTGSTRSEHSRAYWAGWVDGRFREIRCFTENLSLEKWEDPSDRLDYYRGHRAGGEARRAASNPQVPKVSVRGQDAEEGWMTKTKAPD